MKTGTGDERGCSLPDLHSVLVVERKPRLKLEQGSGQGARSRVRDVDDRLEHGGFGVRERGSEGERERGSEGVRERGRRGLGI
jgi:hypothetical protein